jgi:hypothetical protein
VQNIYMQFHLNFLQNDASLETEGRRRTKDTTGDGDVGEIEREDDKGCMIYPYECLTTKVEVYAPDISVTKREVSNQSSTSHSSDNFF